jgi:phage terminase large subunit GpA-like protein
MDHSELASLIAAASPELRAELDAAIARGLRALEVPPPVRMSVWAEEHFYLSAESSYVEGRWKCWPFQRAMMDVIGSDAVQIVTVRKSARVGYTKILLAAIAYFAQHKRRNQGLYQPTDDDRDEFVNTELDPMIRDVKVLRTVFRDAGRKSKNNTVKFKKFSTGVLHVRGGKAAKNYRRLTLDTVYYDELSGFDRDIEKEGAATKLGDKRLEGSTFPKSVRGSTPKIKGHCNVEDSEASADLRLRYHVRCPGCDEEHPLEWGGKGAKNGMRWQGGNPDSVAHIHHCGYLLTQAEYLQIWGEGRWKSDTGVSIDAEGRFVDAAGQVIPAPRHVAFHVWTAYAPQATWPQLVREFLDAKAKAKRGDIADLKTFVNTTLGETWEEKGDTADEHELQKRAEPYALKTVPVGALILTAGIDVQDKRWEIGVWGWGRGMESWAVDHHIIEGNPASEEDWDPVAEYLRRRYPQAWREGNSLPIEASSIDSGHHTQAVYNFVRKYAGQLRLHAVKGSSDEGKPIKGVASAQDVSWQGKTYKNGVKLWLIGTDTAKDLLHGQLQIAPPLPGQPCPGYVHTSTDLPREWYEQLTAETRIPVKTPRGEVLRWIKRRPRNEVLDTRNYATHAAHMLDLHRYPDKLWTRLEAAVQPAPDLFTAAPAKPARPAKPDARETEMAAVHTSAVAGGDSGWRSWNRNEGKSPW